MTNPTLGQWIEDLEDGDEPEVEATCDCGCAFQFCTLRRVAVDDAVCTGPQGNDEDFAYDSRH